MPFKNKNTLDFSRVFSGRANGIRTRVTAVKGPQRGLKKTKYGTSGQPPLLYLMDL